MSSRRIAARLEALEKRRISEDTGAGAIVEAVDASNVLLVAIDAVLDSIAASSSPTSPSRDAFGRQRVSNPTTLFDSKQIFDNQPLLWDDSEVSGATTTSTHSVDRASSILGVAATTAGNRVRQTFQRFNYQPGKSLLVLCTGIIDASGGGTGITRRAGYFDDENGVFFEDSAGTLNAVVRSFATGSAVDTAVAQASWNGDVLDGTGSSGATLDLTKTQLMWFDFEWLGVGSVRMGFVLDGEFIVAHTFHHANSKDVVYMSKANLPIRYEIDNDGTGAASTLEQICSTVIVEGGKDEIGSIRYKSTAGTHVDANTANTIYACVGVRLKAAALAETVDLVKMSMISETNDDFEWILKFSPTVAGTFTYADETNSAVQTATGATANTVTGGTDIDGDFAKSSSSISGIIPNAIRLGSDIAGTPNEIVLCVRPLSSNADIQASITWRERS